MLSLGDQLPNHSLNDPGVAIEEASECSTNKGDPEVSCEADEEEGQDSASAAEEKDRFASYPIGEAPPVHPRKALRERERRDEEACVEGGMALVAHVELEDKLPGVGEDGR